MRGEDVCGACKEEDGGGEVVGKRLRNKNLS